MTMKRSARGVAAAALGAVVALPVPALATPGATPGNATGGDVSTLDDVPAPADAAFVAQQAADKEAYAAAYHAAKFGHGNIQGLSKLAAQYKAKYGVEPGPNPATGGPSSQGAVPLSEYGFKSLNMSYYGQVKNYYCGPASGQMVLSFVHPGAGAYNGASLSQPHLATASYMNTEAAGATTWSSGRFRIGLNRWIYGRDTGYYVDVHAPSASTFINDLTNDVDWNHPFGADTVEMANGPHYNQHPYNLTIGHWLAAYGYDSEGAVAMFADPSHTVWPAASTRFTYASATFTNDFLQSNGITW